MKKKILIIGGSGFLGFNIILSLKRNRNFKITSISRKTPKFLKKIKNIELIKADLSEPKILEKKIGNKNFDIIMNFGGNIEHSNKIQTEKSHFKVCKNLVDFFKKKKVSLFIQAGSSMEYGNLKSPNNEKSKCKPNSIYGKSKFKSTNYIIKKSKFRYVILRLYQIYGPHQKINRVIPLAIKNLLQGKIFKTSSGNQVRDFLYVSDFVSLIKKIITIKKIKSGIYNAGSGKQTSLKTLVNKIGVLIKNGKIEYNAISMRKNEPKFLYPSIKKIKKGFNWRPQINIFSGLKKTISFYEK